MPRCALHDKPVNHGKKSPSSPPPHLFACTELRGLKKFAQSGLTNHRPEVAALLDLLTKSLRSDRPAPDKETAFRQIFKRDSYDDHRVRLAMSGLYQLAGEFLAVQDFLHDASANQLRLAQVLRRRQLPDPARAAFADAAAAEARQPWRNADFYEEHYHLSLERHRFELEAPISEHLDLQALSCDLDQAFLARKLWQSCFMLAHQTAANTTYDFGLLDASLAHLEASDALAIPAIAVYFYCYRALTNPTDTTFFHQFKTELLAHSTLFPIDERRDLFVLAINFCIRQYNAGNPVYLAEQFDFYREGLAKKYFLTEGTLSRYTYLNAATSGLAMHELDWVEHFIHEYRDLLPEVHRESLFSFNLARLEYQRCALGAALQLLQKADYKDLLLSLAAKMLQLKIYYELTEFDLLESHLQAFATFIRRKKALGYHRENYQNTLHFTRKLLETNRFDKVARAALRAEMEATKALAEREWLLGQV